jgi:pimeloyl-ACP methyl ester carboxylesterase
MSAHRQKRTFVVLSGRAQIDQVWAGLRLLHRTLTRRPDRRFQVPTVLVPGMLCSPRLYTEQLPALWRSGPVTVASLHHDDSLAAIADRILASAPEQFRLVGLSMGGYLTFEIMRRAGHRVTRLALLNTTARADTPKQANRRHEHVALTREGCFAEVVDALARRWVPAARSGDIALQAIIRQMAAETGPEAFIRQQTAIAGRPDSRVGLSAIACPVLVITGADDQATTPAAPPRLLTTSRRHGWN